MVTIHTLISPVTLEDLKFFKGNPFESMIKDVVDIYCDSFFPSSVEGVEM